MSLLRLFVEYGLYRSLEANMAIVDGKGRPIDRNDADLRRLMRRLERRYLVGFMSGCGEAGYRHLQDRLGMLKAAYRAWRRAVPEFGVAGAEVGGVGEGGSAEVLDEAAD